MVYNGNNSLKMLDSKNSNQSAHFDWVCFFRGASHSRPYKFDSKSSSAVYFTRTEEKIAFLTQPKSAERQTNFGRLNHRFQKRILDLLPAHELEWFWCYQRPGGKSILALVNFKPSFSGGEVCRRLLFCLGFISLGRNWAKRMVQLFEEYERRKAIGYPWRGDQFRFNCGCL